MLERAEIHTAIKMIEDKKNNLKRIIDIGCQTEAFQLLALHIDFIGKLLHRLKPTVTVSWDKNRPDADECFKNVCNQLDSMCKYDEDILRDNLRNGMIHNECPKPGLTLTHTLQQKLNGKNKTINLNDFYSDFCKACNDVIKMLNDYEKSYPGSLKTNKKFPRLIIGVHNDNKKD